MRHELQNLTKQRFLDLGYSVDEIDTEIFLVKDFLTDEEVKTFLDIANSASEEDWSVYYMEGLKSFAKTKFGHDDLDELVESGKLEITHRWKDKNLYVSDQSLISPINERASKIVEIIPELTFNGIDAIQRQYEGAELIVHVDNHTDPSLVYAAIMYLNDDYTDGELIFPDRGIEVKPKAKTLAIFPTHEEYLHGTNAPGPGPVRYVLPCFIGIRGFYETHRY
jgi:hypothetical protein